MAKYLYTYSPHSQGAKALAEAMGINRIKHEGSRFRGGPTKTVINWGCSSLPDQITGGPNGRSVIINDPEVIKVCSNKLSFFQKMREHDLNYLCPAFTTDIMNAQRWLNDGNSVVARKLLNGSGARGLEIIDPGEELPVAPLYTMYMKKKDEYRVHVVNGEIIDIQRKGLRQELADQDDINWRVRNLENGFVFVRNEAKEVPAKVREFPLRAMRASGLTFGAVDIVWNARGGTAYILEINTAPGLQGTTVENYATAFANI